jgi:excisionase family DNA binding protein
MTRGQAPGAAEDALAAAIRDLVRAEVAAAMAEREGGPVALLSVEQAAARLGLGRSVTYGLVMRGDLRSFRVGRRRLVPADAVGDYIAAQGAA